MTNASNTKIFARVERGTVQEIFCTAEPIAKLFHPALVWVDVTDTPGVGAMWTYDGSQFAPPAAPPSPVEAH